MKSWCFDRKLKDIAAHKLLACLISENTIQLSHPSFKTQFIKFGDFSLAGTRAVTDENGVFDAPCHEDLTLIVMNDWCVDLPLSFRRGYFEDFFSVVVKSWV